MDLPEQVKQLVGELGDSLAQALANDEHCRDLASQIQVYGYDIMLVLEATVGLKKREATDAEDEREGEEVGLGWNDDDRRFLKTFRIALD
jgi:hypothetical protein